MMNDISFQDGGHQLDCVLKRVLHLKSMEKINKHWKLKGLQEKNLSLVFGAYRKIHPLESLPGITRQSLVMPRR